MMGGILREFANLNNHLLGEGNVGEGALQGLVDYVGAVEVFGAKNGPLDGK